MLKYSPPAAQRTHYEFYIPLPSFRESESVCVRGVSACVCGLHCALVCVCVYIVRFITNLNHALLALLQAVLATWLSDYKYCMYEPNYLLCFSTDSG